MRKKNQERSSLNNSEEISEMFKIAEKDSGISTEEISETENFKRGRKKKELSNDNQKSIIDTDHKKSQSNEFRSVQAESLTEPKRTKSPRKQKDVSSTVARTRKRKTTMSENGEKNSKETLAGGKEERTIKRGRRPKSVHPREEETTEKRKSIRSFSTHPRSMEEENTTGSKRSYMRHPRSIEDGVNRSPRSMETREKTRTYHRDRRVIDETQETGRYPSDIRRYHYSRTERPRSEEKGNFYPPKRMGNRENSSRGYQRNQESTGLSVNREFRKRRDFFPRGHERSSETMTSSVRRDFSTPRDFKPRSHSSSMERRPHYISRERQDFPLRNSTKPFSSEGRSNYSGRVNSESRSKNFGGKSPRGSNTLYSERSWGDKTSMPRRTTTRNFRKY